MKTIYKYPISFGKSVIELRRGYKILYLTAQNDIPYIWVELYPDNKPEKVHLFTFGTGYELPDEPNIAHIGSYMLMDGKLVYHVYKEITK